MRLLLATMSHETNTFSPVPTKLERFCRDGTTLLSGQTAIDFYRGTGTCMGGYLAVADEVGAEVVVPVCATAPPSGPVESEAYETFCRMITDEVAKGGFDAVWLDLHGAMVTDRFDDGEGELLRRIRAINRCRLLTTRVLCALVVRCYRCGGRCCTAERRDPVGISAPSRPNR